MLLHVVPGLDVAASLVQIKRVPREVVLAKAPGVLDFADEVGLLHLFDREYPA